MKFLCLGYYDPAAFDQLTEADQQAVAAACQPLDEELYRTGRVAAIASLAHRTAVTLRPVGEQTVSYDGPFTETKEVIGSFFIIEAENMDEAIRIASLHPAARWGAHLGFGVEVRPIEMLDVKATL